MRFSNLDDWLRWQEGLHPRAIDLGLDRVSRVWRRLRPDGLACPVITIGGTNGKGSCSAITDAVARAAGYRTGCYTSPHLRRYNERIRIAGEPVADAALCDAFARVDEAREDVSLTYFEFGTLAALDLFAAARLDLAILEVGLGGRLDAVNLLDADVALVTTVALDHADWLGSDLNQIAREKAGIFRPGRPAVIGQQEPPPALRESAEAAHAQVFQYGREFATERTPAGWNWIGPARSRHALPEPALRSGHQIANAAAALMGLDCLGERLPIGQSAVRSGLLQVRLEGRLQVVPGEVDIILDVAHNPHAMENLVRDLGAMACRGNTHVLFGCMADKDAASMMTHLQRIADAWHLASPPGQRSARVDDLSRIAADLSRVSAVSLYDSIASALDGARAAARPGDRILVTGSFLTVAAALERLDPDPQPPI